MSNKAISYYSMAVTIGLVSCALIFAKSFLTESGGLSPDSTHYLGLAENILLGNGLQVTNSGRSPAGLEHFAIWPVGYPVMIYAVADLLNVSVFIASKLLNALLLIASMAVITRTFGKNGPILALIMGFGGTIEIFSHTWSEAPFIFFLICFSAITARLFSNKQDHEKTHALLLLIVGLCLFLSRYIGAFSIGIILLAGIYKFYQQERFQSAKLFVAAAALLLIAGAYLAYNKIQVGYATGMPRIPAFETSLELSKQLLISFADEFVFPLPSWEPTDWAQNIIVVFQFSALVLLLGPMLRSFKLVNSWKDHTESLVFIGVGVIYLAAIIILRWRSQFDAFGYRLLNPGMVLVLLGIFNIILTIAPEHRNRIAIFLFGMSAISLGTHTHSALTEKSAINYTEATIDRLEKYRDIPAGSIVIFGDTHLNYLRPDLHRTYPHFRPYYSTDESWDEFIKSLDKSRRIFVEISDNALTPNRYHETVRRVVMQHQDQDLFELRVN